jgi:hypothetical protein
MYNRLSRLPWLLRGEAEERKFAPFSYVKGEFFFSGDYESATDNLNFHVQRALLEELLVGAEWVPDSVKKLALESQSLILEGPGIMARQRRGQLMGNLLSFPLLCLVNYLAFRWYSGDYNGELPVRVNGDDIVFRAPRAVGERWAAGVSGAGLTLSIGKTMVCDRYFTLNSCLFRGEGSGCKRLRVVRATALGLRPGRSPVESLAGRWSRLLKDFPAGRARKIVLANHFLKINSYLIVSSRRSVTRGLQMRVPPESIVSSGLWPRECFYLSFPAELPLPLSPEAREKCRVPPGWVSRRVENVTKEMLEVSKGVAGAFVEMSWTLPEGGREEFDWVSEVRVSGPSYTARSKSRLLRSSRLLHLSARNTKRYLKPGVQRDRWVTCPHEVIRECTPRGKRLWLPTEFVTNLLGAWQREGSE